MTTLSLDFNTLNVTDPYDPAPAGFSRIANPVRIATGTPKVFQGTTANNCIWINNTALVGSTFYARVTLDSVGSDAMGVVACDPAGIGYQLLINSTLGARLFSMTSGGTLGTQKGSTASVTALPGQVVEIEVRLSAGSVRLLCKVNGVTLIDFSESTAIASWRGGAVARSSGRLRSMEVEFTAGQAVTSINAGNPIPVGQSNIVALHTGFGGAITAITTNRPGITASIVSSASSSTTFSISGWSEAGEYPVLDSNVTFTFARSGESASGSQTVTYPVGWVKVTFAGAIIDDPKLFGKIFADAGHTVEGAVLYYDPSTVEGLVINPDTGGTASSEGTFDAWLLPTSGATAGEMYFFELSILEGGVVVPPEPTPGASIAKSIVRPIQRSIIH